MSEATSRDEREQTLKGLIEELKRPDTELIDEAFEPVFRVHARYSMAYAEPFVGERDAATITLECCESIYFGLKTALADMEPREIPEVHERLAERLEPSAAEGLTRAAIVKLWGADPNSRPRRRLKLWLQRDKDAKLIGDYLNASLPPEREDLVAARLRNDAALFDKIRHRDRPYVVTEIKLEELCFRFRLSRAVLPHARDALGCGGA